MEKGTKALLQKLQEAANVGEWLESRLHLSFTEIADNMFGQGYLTREERISLSSAIGVALDAFRAEIEAKSAGLYKRGPWVEPPAPAPDTEAMSEAATLDGGFVALVEKAVRGDGTIPVKLIQPGWGSSGYYSQQVLERDGPKVFAPGTKMYWNHPTPTEEAQRPEGDLNALAAELISAARWDGSGVAGPGLYADAKVFEAYQGSVNDLAPHIGVSIRALGRAVQGEAEGRKGALIQEIASARSVDFVTEPGAGGQIVQMFEAARKGPQTPTPGQRSQLPSKGDEEMSEELKKQLTEANNRLAAVEQQNARLQEALLLSQAADFVAAHLRESALPDVTKARLATALAAKPPVADGKIDQAAYKTQIAEAIKAEQEYLTQVAGLGRIVGMGGSTGAPATEDEAAIQKRMEAGFAAMGLTEGALKHAVNGRA